MNLIGKSPLQRELGNLHPELKKLFDRVNSIKGEGDTKGILSDDAPFLTVGRTAS